jgi:hypothetical protein
MLRLSSARLAPPFGVQNIYFWKSILPWEQIENAHTQSGRKKLWKPAKKTEESPLLNKTHGYDLLLWLWLF